MTDNSLENRVINFKESDYLYNHGNTVVPRRSLHLWTFKTPIVSIKKIKKLTH